MNTQELASTIQVSVNELSEVLRVLGIDPTQQSLPETFSGNPLDVYLSRLKKAAIDKKSTLLEVAKEIKQAVEGMKQQQASASSGAPNSNSSGFGGVDGLAWLEQYFFALTRGQCTAADARLRPDSLWGITWLTLEGTALRAAEQVAAVTGNAIAALSMELILKGNAGQQISGEIQNVQERINQATNANLLFFDMAVALPGSPTEQLQLSGSATPTEN